MVNGKTINLQRSYVVFNSSCCFLNIINTDGGQVLACGSNSFGQLGVGAATVHSAQLLVVEVSTERVLLSPLML